jgi:ubiquinone/menaquinone biosynthesis C-methylase UbiE
MIKKKAQLWRPDRPTSHGATAYHDAVVDASWHIENIAGLIALLHGKTKSTDTIVDFGAGTGASAVYVLKSLKGKLLLVDNSASWLGKAYEVLRRNKRVEYSLLGKKDGRYLLLDELLGKSSVDHVVSANTVHLIPNIAETFAGIFSPLKKGGSFSFQSGNIMRKGREHSVFMIDGTVSAVHDRAIALIRTDPRFLSYKNGLDLRIEQERSQRELIFPKPRPVEFYVEAAKKAGFIQIAVTHKQIKVRYADWLKFLRVRRLQAGILPEVGGRDATPQQEKDRDLLIKTAAQQFFAQLKRDNPFATRQVFTAEWVYVTAKK